MKVGKYILAVALLAIVVGIVVYLSIPSVHKAVMSRDLERVKQLVRQDFSNLLTKSIAGNSLLHRAAIAGSGDIAKYLIECGLEVNASNNAGRTSLHLAAKYHCVFDGHDSKVIETLLYQGADVTTTDNSGQTPLHLAVQAECEEATRILLWWGGNPLAKDNAARTPLSLAETRGIEPLRLLLTKAVTRTESRLKKNDIPIDIPGEVKSKIERLLSVNADDRAAAAFEFAPSTLGPPDVRAATLAEALPAVPFLVDLLDDFAKASHYTSTQGSTTPVDKALFALMQIGSPAVRPLIGTLHDENSRVREGSLWALGWIEDPEAIPAIVRVLKEDRIIKVRSMCIVALEIILVGGPKRHPGRDKSNDPVGIRALEEATRDKNPEIAARAQQALNRIAKREKASGR
ncbi:MAG: hypothetical protein GY854_29180 [Deltaproteobacteria bacterium]|nr:hypothetical protein [Deltaproteobacteria bacterium]